MRGERTWGLRLPALGLVLLLALAAPAQDKDVPKKKRPRADPSGTTIYMGQLRLLFDSWDRNKDDYLDKQELAWAFVGPRAKPYDYKRPPKKDAKADPKSEKETAPDKGPKEKKARKPDYSRQPDYVFLKQLDQDGDGKISRDEYLAWAREFAIQLRDQDKLQKKLAALQQKLAKARPGTKSYQRVLTQVRAQQDAIRQANAAARAYDAAVRKQLKQLER